MGQTNEVSVALVESLRHAGWTDGDEIKLLREYSEIIKKDFDLKNSFQVQSNDTSLQINQLCVINNNLLQQLIALRQDFDSLKQNCMEAIHQLKENVEDIGGEVNTLKALHPSSPFYKDSPILQAAQRHEPQSLPSPSSKKHTGEDLVSKEMESTVKQAKHSYNIKMPKLDKHATSVHDLNKHKITVSDLLFTLSENNQLKSLQTKLEDTWLHHLPKNERQKYRDTMKLASVVWEEKEEQMLRKGVNNSNKDLLLTACKNIQHRVFKLCEQLEKDHTGRDQRVSKSAKPTYTGIGKRLSTVKKAVLNHKITFDEAIEKSLYNMLKK